jgi:hypothetical protein
MSNQQFTPEFKEEAFLQIVERGFRRHSHLGGFSPEAFERTSDLGSGLPAISWEVQVGSFYRLCVDQRTPKY